MRQSLAVIVTICLLSSPIRLKAQRSGIASTPPTTPAAAGETVRRDVVSWGVGRKIAVRTVDGTRVRGSIESIEADAFAIRHGRQGVIDRVRYDEVSRIGEAGWPIGAKITLGAGVVVGVAILLWLEAALSQ